MIKKPETNVSPKAAIKPYIASAVAEPSPETRPLSLPSLKVRCMHSSPTGPTGVATRKPTTRPFKKIPATIFYLSNSEDIGH
ncbi:MAG: hypothetical protein JW947_03515 [Sedimentisphaerales bacterium]|nr:hypothetical protein [Sedimentisphaerales bacterium]